MLATMFYVKSSPTPATVGDGAIFGDNADVARAIDENAIPRQEAIDFVELRDEVVEKLRQLGEECVR